MTTNVAIPANATAPVAPERTMRRTDASSVLPGSVWMGSVFSMAGSILWRRAQLIGVARGYRRAAVAPGSADIGDHGGDLVVGQALRERRHAIGPGVTLRARREAAVQHHADRVDR